MKPTSESIERLLEACRRLRGWDYVLDKALRNLEWEDKG